jgi:hypothetical protein
MNAPRSLPAAVWRGVRFGGKFTFWLLVILVTVPIVLTVAAEVLSRPTAIYRLLTLQGMARYVVPAVGVPVVGAAIGAVVAGVMLPLASLLNGRPERTGQAADEEPASPFEFPPTPRSREELLRRIVIGPSQEPCELT